MKKYTDMSHTIPIMKKEEREIFNSISTLVYGTPSYWRKLVRKGLTFDKVSDSMNRLAKRVNDNIEKNIETQTENQDEKENKQT